jgi:uncharacterized delta-60 repeat protein
VAIQPTDGKILVAGTADIFAKNNLDYSDFAVARLNPNGTLDTTFGGGKGYVTTQVSPPNSGLNMPYSINLQPNGQILVAGELYDNGTYALAMVRYNANGGLDTTFGTGGEVVNASISPVGFTTQVAIDGSGRIDVAGQSTVGTGGAVVARYLANGALDSTFGTGGYAGPLPLGYALGVALQSTGQIVVYGGVSGLTQAQLVRLNTDGSLDTTFGTNGVYNESRTWAFTGIVIQPADDKIVAVGEDLVNGQGNFAVTRVLANGSAYDSTFGTSGLSLANFNYTNGSGPSSVALDPSGRILVTGSAYNGSSSYYFATARFLGDSTSTPTTLAATATPSPATASAPGPILGALVWNDPTFLDSLASGNRRHTR